MEEKICHWGTEILLNERDAEVGVGEDEIGVSKNQPVMWTGDFFFFDNVDVGIFKIYYYELIPKVY